MRFEPVPVASKRLVGLVGMLVGLVWMAQAGADPVALRDVRGQQLNLSAPAQRIVALAPHFVENLFVIGAGSQIVGAVDFIDFPPEAQSIPSVGGYSSLSAEAILGLRPDLVLAWQSGNSTALIAQLENLGLAVFVEEPRDLAAVAEGLLRLGVLTGREAEARAAAEAFRRRRDALAQQYSARPAVRVFYQIWHQPLQTLNGTHAVNDLIRLCGGENVFAGALPLAPRVSEEAVLAARPQVIIASGQSADLRPSMARWRRWPQLPAVAEGHLHAIRPDWMLRFTPRMLDGAQRLCELLEQARR